MAIREFKKGSCEKNRSMVILTTISLALNMKWWFLLSFFHHGTDQNYCLISTTWSSLLFFDEYVWIRNWTGLVCLVSRANPTDDHYWGRSDWGRKVTGMRPGKKGREREMVDWKQNPFQGETHSWSIIIISSLICFFSHPFSLRIYSLFLILYVWWSFLGSSFKYRCTYWEH